MAFEPLAFLSYLWMSLCGRPEIIVASCECSVVKCPLTSKTRFFDAAEAGKVLACNCYGDPEMTPSKLVSCKDENLKELTVSYALLEIARFQVGTSEPVWKKNS